MSTVYFEAAVLQNAVHAALRFMDMPAYADDWSRTTCLYLNFDGKFLHIRSTGESCLFSRKLPYAAKSDPWDTPILLTRREANVLVDYCKERGKKCDMALTIQEDALRVSGQVIPTLLQNSGRVANDRLLKTFKHFNKTLFEKPFYFDSTIPKKGLLLCTDENFKLMDEARP